ncbi:MAG: rod shape-determining protein MreD [Lawsonibacter sp.]
MTTRDQIHKWFIYALGLFLVWVLDAHDPQPPVRCWAPSPMLLPLAVVSVAVLEGAYAGAGFGLAVGLLWELAYPGGFGGLVFGMALAGMITGAVSQYALSQSFLSCLLCSAGVLGVLDGLRILRILFLQAETLDVLLRIAVPEIALSLCWTPVVYWIFRRIYRRVGGAKLA